ncbi:MAG: radical SAM protein [Myxococcota bacterium]
MNANIELTDHCNIACRMCSQSMRDEAHGAPMRFMDFATWRRALLGLEGLPDVHLCPHWLGEPTLHPQFDRFVEYAFAVNRDRRLFRHFKLHTNAVIFPADRAALLVRLARDGDVFEAVHFSVDAYSRDAYAFVKGKDKRDLVYRNVERFLRLRGDAPRPVAHLAFVVQDGNRHEVRAFVDHWSALLRELGRPFRLTADWPPFDRDALYLRRLNSGDQSHADAIHAEACREVGLAPAARPPGSF